jgi:hypothetical protein
VTKQRENDQKYSNSELHVCPQVADRGNPLVRGGCQVIII